jgi:hypothetical protein
LTPQSTGHFVGWGKPYAPQHYLDNEVGSCPLSGQRFAN